MKHWVLDCGDLTLASCNRIISISPRDGGFDITEECDRNFSRHYTKKEMIELLNEAMQFVINCKD